jgi:FkbM family methyltransferase
MIVPVTMLPRAVMRRLCGTRIVGAVNLTLRGTLNARDVLVPVHAGLGLTDPPLWEQEPWLNAVLATLLDAVEGAFVDVGVNLGQSLLKVKTLRPSTPYVGFEPNPICVAYVRRLISENAFEHTVVAPFGLSDQAATVPLFSRQDDEADSSATVVRGLYSTQAQWAQTPVAVLEGDEALASLNVGRVGVIKIDVEGAELEVVRGLKKTIAAFRPAVVCEVLPTYSGRDGRRAFRQPRIDALVGMMRTFGYQLFRLMPQGQVVPLATIAPHSDASLTNYAFVPEQAVEALTGQPSCALSKCDTT